MLTNNRCTHIAQVIDAVHAQIDADNAVSAYGYTAVSTSPVLALCRDLIDAGHLPTAPMLVFRGTMLCLNVRSLEEAAALEVAPRGIGFVPCAVRRRPPVNAMDGDGS
jgi:hypothetical protein